MKPDRSKKLLTASEQEVNQILTFVAYDRMGEKALRALDYIS